MFKAVIMFEVESATLLQQCLFCHEGIQQHDGSLTMYFRKHNDACNQAQICVSEACLLYIALCLQYVKQSWLGERNSAATMSVLSRGYTTA